MESLCPINVNRVRHRYTSGSMSPASTSLIASVVVWLAANAIPPGLLWGSQEQVDLKRRILRSLNELLIVQSQMEGKVLEGHLNHLPP